MIAFLRRHRELFLVGFLLLAPLVIYLSSGHKGREPNRIDRAVIALASPVQRALEWSFDEISAGVNGYIALRGAREEAQLCRADLSASHAELNALREAALENERLRKLLDYKEGTAADELPARVIGINPSAQFYSVRLDRGEADGIHVGNPVVTPDGVVGQVVRSLANTSDVMLMSDPASRIGLTVQRSRVRGTASGAGGNAPLSIDNVLRSEDLLDGDTVVTSGTDGVFPSGLMIGKVIGSQHGTGGLFLKAQLKPAVDLRHLEEVLVLPSGTASYNQAWLRREVP